MTQFELDRLNDREFEGLVARLVSDREGRTVERFKRGKDGGVDRRFFEVGEIVLQAKHWPKSSFAALRNHMLKEELPKIERLKPVRYILCTSLSLARSEKALLSQDLAPYVKSEADIIGREEVDDFLDRNPSVAQSYYKLWLMSAHVLGFIQNNAIIGRSDFQLQEASAFAPKFVVTEAFEAAVSRLEDAGVVILIGEPGVGKTTAAEQLMLKYAVEGYRPFVINHSLQEAELAMGKDEKQFFYFDDFLGTNYLDALEDNFDSAVVRFIKRVQQDKTKRFVLTSRTTIIQRGLSLSERFRHSAMQRHSYEIKVDRLKWIEKAEILYNHLWQDQLPAAYIDEFYRDRRYLEAIRHPNFNPRLISFITDRNRATLVAPGGYWVYVVSTLANPVDVWEGAYTRQIDAIGQLLVALVVLNGNMIKEGELRNSVGRSDLRARSGLAAAQWGMAVEASLKLCVGSLLSRLLPANGDHPTIGLFNPSVGDYVIRRFADDHESMVEFCRSLRTPSCLHRLSMLVQNKLTKPGVEQTVQQTLAREWLPQPGSAPRFAMVLLGSIIRKPGLADLLAGEIARFAEGYFAAGAECLTDSNLSTVGGYLLGKNLLARNDPHWRPLVSLVIEATDDHETLVELSRVVVVLENAEGIDLQAELRDEVLEHWLSGIDDVVRHRQVLDDYDDLDDYGSAKRTLRRFVENELSEYAIDFPEGRIEDVVEYCDIRGIVAENQEARLHGVRTTWNPDPTKDLYDPNAIADLFER